MKHVILKGGNKEIIDVDHVIFLYKKKNIKRSTFRFFK